MKKKIISIFLVSMLFLTGSMMITQGLVVKEKTKSNGEIGTLNNDAVTWQKTYNCDSGRHIIEINGGYIIASNKYINENDNYRDALLFKIDKQGNEQWSTVFDVQFSEGLYWVEEDIDGGYIATGWTYNDKTKNKDILVAKFSSQGDLRWTKIFDKEHEDYGFGIHALENGYIIFGNAKKSSSNEVLWIIKLTGTGILEWETTSDSTSVSHGREVRTTYDGNFIITGKQDSKPWLAKINSKGSLIWEQTYDIYGGGFSVIETIDGRYVIGGRTLSGNTVGGKQLLLITDSNGNLISQKEYEEYNNEIQAKYGIYCIAETNDGGFILFTEGETGHVTAIDWLLIKTDSNGNEIWRRPYEGLIHLGCSNDYSIHCEVTNDGGFIMIGLSGNSYQKTWIVKTDNNGHLSNTPFEPSIIGPSEGNKGENYEFTFFANDPDGHDVYYRVDFGHSEYANDEWVGPFNPGEEITVSYKWHIAGTYTISVTLYDSTLEYSETATMQITIKQGKSKDILFANLLERYLQKFPILRNLLK